MANGLTTFRLDYLLPPLGPDPGVEAHARQLLARNYARFLRVCHLSCAAHRNLIGDRDPELQKCSSPPLREIHDDIAMDLARQASRVTLIRATHCAVRRKIDWFKKLSCATVDAGWRVSLPTIISSLGPALFSTLCAWAEGEETWVRDFAENYLARQREDAEASTADGIAAGVAELLGSLLLMLDSARATFARLVEPLTRRVLAAGGQTAVFVPLT